MLCYYILLCILLCSRVCTGRASETKTLFCPFLRADGSNNERQETKNMPPSATHRLLSDGLPKVDLLEAAGGLVENLLAVLEAENLLAEDEKLRQRFGDGSGEARRRSASGEANS